MLEISLSAEKIGSIGNFPITNSLLATWIVMGILLCVSLALRPTFRLIPSYPQQIAEIIIEGLQDFFHTVMGHNLEKAFPLLATLFLFIILANWFGLVPGVGTIGFYKSIASRTQTAVSTPKNDSLQEKKFVPLLRGATADLNTTIALAIIAFFSIQYFGFINLGAAYAKRFINLSNPIMFFVGILEIISDFSKVISFAFRLFGNIFAGEVLLAVMAFLMPFIAPLPFLALELFIGFIQALVFSTLTAVFINVAMVTDE
jgi:F-type H+-transporting ATPase subunit a